MNKGIVIKQIGGRFTVKSNKTYVVFARGNLRKNGVLVGDEVEFNYDTIIKVLPRKNRLLRPVISNIDQLILVIAPKPETDFLLVDKMLMYADMNNIDVVICVNKRELTNREFKKSIENQYLDVVKKIVYTSAINGVIDELEEVLNGKISVFAGQSAVGKSTLLNKIFKKDIAETGEMSKIERGKNTTRETELFTINENSFIADTPGFSCLDLINFSPEMVSVGYKEFFIMSTECKYRQCDHIFVDKCDCKVLQELSKKPNLEARYQRYKQLYIQTRDIWRNRYGK